jgi:release factor H-coupled RctB family protein
LELSRVDQLADREAARNLGLSRDALVVLAHSGSRGLGGALHDAWAGGELTDPTDQAAYLAQLAGACRYATANRALLTWRLLTALGATSTARIGQSHDVLHNTVLPTTWRGTPVWLHRKGAAPAEAGQPTVVLGSRGAPSWILLGSGNEDALWSAAHGAGRKLGRAEAVDKLKHRHHRSTLRQTRLGGRVICDDDRLLLAEHPDAYKDVQPVVDSLIEHGVAAKVAALVPLVTVKR